MRIHFALISALGMALGTKGETWCYKTDICWPDSWQEDAQHLCRQRSTGDGLYENTYCIIQAYDLNGNYAFRSTPALEGETPDQTAKGMTQDSNYDVRGFYFCGGDWCNGNGPMNPGDPDIYLAQLTFLPLDQITSNVQDMIDLCNGGGDEDEEDDDDGGDEEEEVDDSDDEIDEDNEGGNDDEVEGGDEDDNQGEDDDEVELGVTSNSTTATSATTATSSTANDTDSDDGTDGSASVNRLVRSMSFLVVYSNGELDSSGQVGTEAEEVVVEDCPDLTVEAIKEYTFNQLIGDHCNITSEDLTTIIEDHCEEEDMEVDYGEAIQDILQECHMHIEETESSKSRTPVLCPNRVTLVSVLLSLWGYTTSLSASN